jgi:hypothetical protein
MEAQERRHGAVECLCARRDIVSDNESEAVMYGADADLSVVKYIADLLHQLLVKKGLSDFVK